MIGFGRYDEQNTQWSMKNDGIVGLAVRVRKRIVNDEMQRKRSNDDAASAIPL